MSERPDRNLAMELVRVTEAAALAAGRWVGRGDKVAADQAAVDAMRLMIDTVSMDGVVVIGEGEKDEAPMLYNGESVGTGDGPQTDVAVDPIDGTRLTALGQPNALAVIALAARGSMFFPGAAVYMEKVATGPEAADAIDITASPEENVRLVAKAKGIRPEEVGVVILIATGTPRSSRAFGTSARASSSSRTATSPARSPRPRAADRRSTCCSGSAARPRASSRPPRSSASAARSRAACTRGTTRSGPSWSTPATTSTRC